MAACGSSARALRPRPATSSRVTVGCRPIRPLTIRSRDRVYFPGPGGTIDYISNPDTATGVVTPVQVAFYGTSNYTANESAYNASIYINTPLTVDTLGNVYFGFEETGSNPSGITDGGIARISSDGRGHLRVGLSRPWIPTGKPQQTTATGPRPWARRRP